MPWNVLAERIAGAAVYGAGGFCAFLLFYMRVLNRMRTRRLKRVLALSAFAGLPCAGAAAGAALGWGPWAAVPLLAVAWHAAMEAAAARAERRLRGAPPVEETAPARPGRWITNRDLRCLRYELAAPPGFPARLRIAHLSDLHINDRMPAAYYRDLAARVAEARPDVVFFTGDFGYSQLDSRLLDETLDGMPARLARFAVLGNHDVAAGAEAMADQIAARGIRVLRNGCETLALPGGARALVCGDDTPWCPPEDPAPPARGEAVLFGLTHSPDNAPRFARAGAFAVFAGHFHGGQLRWPWIGPAAVPSRFGRRLTHGHYELDGTHVFLSAGVGLTFPPFRLRCPPDWFLVDLVARRPGEGGRAPAG